MRPFGSDQKAAEKQNAQNHNYRDYDDLDQAHSKSLKIMGDNKGPEQVVF